MSDFVKAMKTETPKEKSQADIITMLQRYGASGFGFRQIGDVIEARFHIPRKAGEDHTVAIPINITHVKNRLIEVRKAKAQKGRYNPSGRIPDDAQAERVAWRILYLWIDAALAAVSIGAQSIEEAFFAHLIVGDTDGSAGRLIDYVHSLQSTTGGQLPAARLMLAAGTTRKAEAL